MNNNQHGVLFIFGLLSYHTSTSFGRISSHHQEAECIHVAYGTCFAAELTVSWPRPEVSWPVVPMRQMFETGFKISVTLIFDVLCCSL
jgi:hypothetical protein